MGEVTIKILRVSIKLSCNGVREIAQPFPNYYLSCFLFKSYLISIVPFTDIPATKFGSAERSNSFWKNRKTTKIFFLPGSVRGKNGRTF